MYLIVFSMFKALIKSLTSVLDASSRRNSMATLWQISSSRFNYLKITFVDLTYLCIKHMDCLHVLLLPLHHLYHPIHIIIINII